MTQSDSLGNQGNKKLCTLEQSIGQCCLMISLRPLEVTWGWEHKGILSCLAHSCVLTFRLCVVDTY